MEGEKESVSDLLILLVGSNPLPIYVTAKYMMKGELSSTVPRPDHVLFLYSNDTKEYTEAVMNILQQKDSIGKGSLSDVSIGDNQRDFQALHREITGQLQTLQPVSSVHLNITGGTKPMAVASYEAVCAAVDGCSGDGGQPRVLVSDIDPDEHRLKIYERKHNGRELPRVESPTVLPHGCDLRRAVSLELKDLASLHRLSIGEPGVEKYCLLNDLVDTNQFADEALQDLVHGKRDSAIEAWQKAAHEEPQKTGEQKDVPSGSGHSGDEELCLKKLEEDKCKKLSVCLAKQESRVTALLSAVRQACPSLHVFFQPAPVDGVWLFDQSKKELLDPLTKYIEGIWLEAYMLQVTSNVLSEFQQKTSIPTMTRQDVKVQKGQGGRERELDVVGVCGYELLLVSCTTDDSSSICKGKVFEAFQRARELGGDHAETVVVTLLDPKHLQEVRDDMSSFDAEQHVHIIGQDAVRRQLEGEGTVTDEIRKIIEG